MTDESIPDRSIADRPIPDRIELRGLRVLGVHGALPEEQDRAQPFEIDLDVEADLSVAGASDHLSDTVDYGAVAAVVAAVVGGQRFRLLERLAQRVADEVTTADPRIRAVTVTVRKLRPPVPVDLTSAGVRITRRRPPGGGPGELVTEKGARAPLNVTGGGVPGDGGAWPRRQGVRRRCSWGWGRTWGTGWARSGRRWRGCRTWWRSRRVYETEPVGGPDGQPPYLNLVVELSTDLSPRRLLEVAHELEAAAGRERAERFGPRTLDVDILLVGDEVVDEPDLTVPHPRMHERRFVLVPLADLAPDLLAGLIRRTGLGRPVRRGPAGR